MSQPDFEYHRRQRENAVNKHEYEARLKPLKNDLIALSHKLDALPVGSPDYHAASNRLSEVQHALAAMDDEFNQQNRQ